MHAAVNGFCPEYISKVLIPVSVLPCRAAMRSSSSGAFDIPRTSKEFEKRAFSVTGPAAWSIPTPSLRQTTNIGQFKCAIKAHLYGISYNMQLYFCLYVLLPAGQLLV